MPGSEHEWDEDRRVWYMGETDTHRIEIMPMLFNDRLVLTPKHCLHIYDYGWCFNKGGDAFKAAIVWNPDTEPEPPGFKKRVGRVRQLPTPEEAT